MSEKLTLTATLNKSRIPVANHVQLVYLLLEVGGAERAGPAAVNLNLVIDTSDSMRMRVATDEQALELVQMGLMRETFVDGVPAWDASRVPVHILEQLPSRIDLVKRAIHALVEQLGPADRFSLVAFAGRALTLIPNSSGEEEQRLLAALDELINRRLGDDTYMGQGMRLGLEEARRGASPGMVSRLLVLTDGFTMDETECQAQAEAAMRQGISISTVGLTDEFNEALLISMADRSGGNAYHVSNAGELPGVFAQEWAAVQAVAYRNLEFKAHVMQGVELRAAYRVKPVIGDLGEIPSPGGSFNVPLGDLQQDEPPAVLLELIVPPRQAGTYRLARLMLAYDDPGGGPVGGKVRQDVVAQYTHDRTATAYADPRVMNVVERLVPYKLQARALQEAEAGDVFGATRKLQAAATRLLDMGEEELAGTLQQQARELAQSGQMDAGATKRLRYETRRFRRR
jgi:Ca-activated chloride channel family protein